MPDADNEGNKGQFARLERLLVCRFSELPEATIELDFPLMRNRMMAALLGD